MSNQKNDIINKYSKLYASPYLSGVFLGANAIKDVALYVDGPDCNFYRVDMVYKTHDLFSTLKDPSINTKLYFSGVMPNKMISGYEDKIKRKLSLIEQNDSFNLGIITAMPVTSLLGIQYNNLFDGFNKEFIFVPSYADKFWIDGYEMFLRGIAKNITLNLLKEKENKSLSIVGFLFDRNEGDCLGNIDEIKRILTLIGISVDCIWLDGGNYSELNHVEKSKLIVSLPYGKHASKVLGRRLGVDVLELENPFGFKGTIDFIQNIGDYFQIDTEQINSVINKEVLTVKNKIDLLNNDLFLNKNFIYAGDPFLENGIQDIANLLGMNLIKTYKYIGDIINNDNIDNIDFVIGNSEYNLLNKKKIEFSFPSYNTHFLTNRAFMGFYGLLNFIERLYNELGKNNL